MKGFTIAIDGPVAAGKGTIASDLAKKLNAIYIYTGGMYRALALACMNNGINLENEDEVLKELDKNEIEENEGKVFLNGKDVTEEIKHQDVAHASSIISAYGEVRKALNQRQKQMAAKFNEKGRIVIIDGRDAGTAVFPDSPFKIYLTATPEVRAQRRVEQFKELGRDESYEAVLAEVRLRDENDTEREVDPLVTNPEDYGYFILDNSNLSEEETFQIIFSEMKKRGLYDQN